MKKLIIGFLLGASLFVAPKALADWKRLREVDSLKTEQGTLRIIFDDVEKVNCYLYEGRDTYSSNGVAYGSAITCLPIK